LMVTRCQIQRRKILAIMHFSQIIVHSRQRISISVFAFKGL
jgi:hypothetical protein